MQRTTCPMYFVLDGPSLHFLVRSGVTFYARYQPSFNRPFLLMER